MTHDLLRPLAPALKEVAEAQTQLDNLQTELKTVQCTINAHVQARLQELKPSVQEEAMGKFGSLLHRLLQEIEKQKMLVDGLRLHYANAVEVLPHPRYTLLYEWKRVPNKTVYAKTGRVGAFDIITEDSPHPVAQRAPLGSYIIRLLSQSTGRPLLSYIAWDETAAAAWLPEGQRRKEDECAIPKYVKPKPVRHWRWRREGRGATASTVPV